MNRRKATCSYRGPDSQSTVDKFIILDAIVSTIRQSLDGALIAADEARATATNRENVAENKYDTLGLEAAYLAHGQSERVLQLEKDLAEFALLREQLSEHTEAGIGSLVKLEQGNGATQFVFIGLASGGLRIQCDGVTVTVITPASPLGSALIGTECGDEIILDNASPMNVASIW